MRGKTTGRALSCSASLLLLAALCVAPPAGAQTTNATVRGTITDAGGSPVGDASVSAVNQETGFTAEGRVQGNGDYSISLPPGSYEILVSSPKHEPQAHQIRVQIGQSINFDVKLEATAGVAEEITVTGEAPAVEIATSEVATNVTREQIENLPQNSRNFLNFAALAPGVRLSHDELNQNASYGAQEARNINVFIDGATYKDDVLQGGIIGQDASRGNPFPQNAVREFRVLTQNFKAEYQKASSAIITAVTKSGGNKLTGDAFTEYQDKSLVALDTFAEKRGEKKPAYERFQTGLSLGGPIVKDKLNFFLSYEGNRQNRESLVTAGRSDAPAFLKQFEGVFVSPFRETLFFGKLSFQPSSSQLVDLSVNGRHETDVRSFGGTTSFQSAENAKQDVGTGIVKHQLVATRFLAESTLSYQDFTWNPSPSNPNLVGQDFQGILRIGGRDTEQKFDQQRLALREDVTYLGLEAHQLKAGVTFDWLDYRVKKSLNGNPVFRYGSSFDIPFEAGYGTGDPNLDTKNRQYGFFAQDDWTVNGRLTLNLGLRWDYETNMINNDYVTPAAVRAAVQSFVPARYFTNGNQRPGYKNAWQPRLGFAYDVTGEGRTVVFGGFGRYYDRTLYNDTLDERFRQQFAVRTFRFSPDGLPRDGQPTIKWRPEFLSKAALDALIASGVAPNPEVFLIENDTKPPYSDQWSLGVRRQLGSVLTALSYENVRSYHGYSYVFGNRRPNGDCCFSVPGFGNVLLSTDDKQTWYKGVYLTVDRPYSPVSRWGASLAYTYAKAEQNGGDLFSLDFPRVQDYPRYPVNNDQRHTVIANGIVGLPWGLKASTLISLGSGEPYHISDASRGFGPNEFRFRRNAGRPEKSSFIIPNAWAFRRVDLRLQKEFSIGRAGALGVSAEVFNAFNYENFGCYNGFIAPATGTPNPDFGKPACLIDPPRRLQFGIKYNF